MRERAAQISIGTALMCMALFLSACAASAEPPIQDTTSEQISPQSESSSQKEVKNQQGPQELSDPLEGFNRNMLSFNFWLDDWFLNPLSKGYHFVTPQFVRTGVNNFSGNLREPSTALNSTLQLDFKNTGTSLGRFALNSTVGILGLFDPATYLNLKAREEDFGQTLASWRMGPGPYVVLPVLGPATVRGAVGRFADYVLAPLSHADIPSYSTYNGAAFGLELLDTRRRLDPQIQFARTSMDPYTVVKVFWWKARLNDLDGKTDSSAGSEGVGSQNLGQQRSAKIQLHKESGQNPDEDWSPNQAVGDLDDIGDSDEIENFDEFDEFDDLDDFDDLDIPNKGGADG